MIVAAAVIVFAGLSGVGITLVVCTRDLVAALRDNAAMQAEQLQTDLRLTGQDIAGAIQAQTNSLVTRAMSKGTGL